jgi:cellobiose phosphorylase
MLDNRYGRFDESGRAFTITDSNTPTPWVNVVSNGRYGFVVSHNGGGFSWLDNSQLNVLTRWEMDLVRDDHGRFLYVADRDTGEVWSLSPAPCRTKFDAYSCAHTQGSSTFTTEHSGVRAVWTLTVAPNDPVEVWTVELTNLRAVPRRLRIASWFEWCCGVAPDAKREFHRLFITTRHDSARQAVFAEKNMWDVPARNEKEHWNRPWPYVAAHAVGGIDFDKPFATSDKELFLGRYGDPIAPAGMTGPGGVDGFGRFVDSSCALGGDFTLAAGATVKLHYLTTIAPTRAEVETLLDKYQGSGKAIAAAGEARSAWAARLSPTGVSTAEPSFDLLNNHWLPYQAISGRLWARTGYYQQSGAFGYRDQLQDSQVWLPLEPKRTRDQIMLHAAHQFADGSVYHWWHPLAEFGLRTRCSDDYLWLPFLVAAYIRETGDLTILDATAGFVDEPDAKSTILDHCQRAFARGNARLSERGLPHIGSCDWNDGLSAMGVDEKGESVWLALFMVHLFDDWAVIAGRRSDGKMAGDFISRRERMTAAINTHAWDGAWFKGATTDAGHWLGSKANAPGPAQIFLNCQTWAILTSASTPERLASAWKSVREQLLGEMGPLLIAPAYTQPEADIGYITRYSPGSRENGGVYMHAATWALAAACKQRDSASVEQIWNAISPPIRAAKDADAYRAEPFVTPGNVDGPLSDHPGKAGWTWYTGSAAWLNRVCLEWVLGIRPTWEGLSIDPVPFPQLGAVDVVRTWRGRKVRVRFDAREFSPMAAARVTLNGRPIAGGVLNENDLSPSGVNDVTVSWGVVTTKQTAGTGAAERSL